MVFINQLFYLEIFSFKKKGRGEFPGGPVVRIPSTRIPSTFAAMAWVQSQVGELRSCKAIMAKKNLYREKKIFVNIYKIFFSLTFNLKEVKMQ